MTNPPPQDPEKDLGAIDREQLLANATAEFLDLQSHGEGVDVESFCRRHADLMPELRTELQTMEHLEELLQPAEAPGAAEQPKDELPERLSGHKVLSEIGSGGMGRVLLALDERLDRKVAIKVLSRRYWDNTLLRDRFMQEARAMAKLSHPNVVAIYNLGQPDEPPHFVMEYLEGAPLAEAARALNLRQKAELMRKVALAVDFLHQHGIIHRDLKPGNILVRSDLEPKVLDFGLALRVGGSGTRLTMPGEVVGTRDYFSPEQARAEALDARSDVFSLGTVFYQLLTGEVPFHGETFQDEVRAICDSDPILPRRIDPTIPGELQNICLKALEKNPSDRYNSTREMANDLERFLAGEPVLAAPTSYSRLMAGKIEQHLRELQGWAQDEILSESEYDSFRKLYDRLVEHEDAWIMQVRRLTLSQVSLYLGAWILAVGAALVALFHYRGLTGTPAVLVVSAAAAPPAYLGVRSWKQGQRRIGVAYLLAFCLLWPITLLVAMTEYKLLTAPSRNNEALEFFSKFTSFKRTTNAQLWWSLLLSLPAYYGLRRFTGASVFSLVFAVMAALLCVVTLLRMGLLEWLENDTGRAFLDLLPFAALFFLVGILIERLRYQADSLSFYIVGVTFTFAGLSGVALFHEPYAQWLMSVVPRTRGQVEYLFIINAAFYLLLQFLADRFPASQMRSVAKIFRFVIPGHILTSLLILGLTASARWHKLPHGRAFRGEARFFEILLPLVACAFVFGSIPKQMKNFFANGLLFLAIGIARLQQDLFKDKGIWPISLLVIGLLLMLGAANYPRVRLGLGRLIGRKP